MRRKLLFHTALISAWALQFASGEPSDHGKVLGSGSCSTSGCHGGAGVNRGAYHIWKNLDPHHNSAATLGNGRSRVMAEQLGLGNPETSSSCTICHAPMRQVNPEILSETVGKDMDSVSCANCHGAESNWLLSHTRPEYPRDALAKLGMRQLGTAYQRANNCVACHQNLNDKLVGVKHPPLVFELDGLLDAEPKHWREEAGFSHAQTWLVGQAVALRETAAQASREPGALRDAEIEAIKVLLETTGTGWDESGTDLIRSADNYAKRISSNPLNPQKCRAILARLIAHREPFQIGSFKMVAEEYKMWATGYYAERLTLAIDRLNQSLIAGGEKGMVSDTSMNGLFDAAKPPKSFDADVSDFFLRKLDGLSNPNPDPE